eukprot:m.92392 g.92392  ORF g.92392 m.92392 type:complete len:108 (-) comp14665_c0_seq6:474-797(-)
MALAAAYGGACAPLSLLLMLTLLEAKPPCPELMLKEYLTAELGLCCPIDRTRWFEAAQTTWVLVPLGVAATSLYSFLGNGFSLLRVLVVAQAWGNDVTRHEWVSFPP